ncbi:O-antigen ligase family protein [Candidatus Peregrinibacteria bacterium]|nr:O-antigen ligase family protein [Candidatus Peregrinibacteria bacterium]
MLNKLLKIFWGAFLFIFPFSLTFVVYEEFSYRFGNFNPYVTGFIYLPEILLGTVFILWLIDKFRISDFRFRISKNWLWILLLLFLINASVVTVINGDYILLGFFLLRIFEAIIIYLFTTTELLPIKTVVQILLGGAAFQLILGWFQWRLNHSVGLKILGEQVISSETYNVAKTDIEGIKQIRPYGTFLHPNILAAYLMSVMLISIPYLKKFNLLFWLIVLTGGVYFTKSTAAGLITLVAFGLMILFSFLKDQKTKKGISLILLVILLLVNAWFFQNSEKVNFSDSSWQERLSQNIVSREMFDSNVLGVGIGDFTWEMENYASEKLAPWEFQPVHNVYYLVLNELGIQGLLLLLIAIITITYYYWKQGSIIPLFALILIAPFDHFLWDSYVGLILVAIVFGFFSLQNSHNE